MISLILGVPAAAGLLYWLVVWVRVARTARRMPRVHDGLALPDPATWPLVTVVIPAHNERRVIDACARGLRDQTYPNLRIVFVLDRCTDETAALLRPHVEADARVRVIENGVCPADWAGKCHAAWLGATAQPGPDEPAPGPEDYLLFSDADTRFSPQLVRAAVLSARASGAGLLSLLPRLTVHAPFERIVQPVASMTLMRMYPIERVDHPTSPRPFANGQFMLFRRDCYDAVDGHAGVRAELLEDLAFARRASERGHRVALLSADDLLEVSMYDSFEAFSRGWTRIFIEACKRKPGRLRKNAVRAIASGVVVPVAQAGLVVVAAVALARGAGLWPFAVLAFVAVGLTAQAAALLRIYRLMGAPAIGALGYPIGSVVVASMLWRGAGDLVRGRPIRWGGREYVLRAR